MGTTEGKMNFQSFLEKPFFFYINIVIFFFLLNGLCSRVACRWDLSRDQSNSVSQSTAKVFRSLKEPVLIEAYITKNVTGEISSEIQPILSILEEMGRVGGDKIKLHIYNPDNEKLRKKAEEHGISGIPIAQQKDIETNVRLGYFGIHLQQDSKSVIIPLIDRNWFIQDLEYRILREIKRFQKSQEKSNIAIANAFGLSSARAWTRAEDQNKDNIFGFKTTLEKEMGTIEDLSLEQAIPSRIETLFVVGLPDLEEKEYYHLDQFLLRGGDLICLLGSFDFKIQGSDPRLARFNLGGAGGLGQAKINKEKLGKLNQWLDAYGLKLRGEILLEPSQAVPVWDFKGRFPKQILYPAWAVYDKSANNLPSQNPALLAIQQLIFPWFSGLDIKQGKQEKVKYDVLVQSTEKVKSMQNISLDYLEVQKLTSTSGNYLGYKVPLAVLASGDFRSAYSRDKLPKGVDRNLYLKKQANETKGNIILIGSPYLVSDIMLKNQIGTTIFSLNSTFILNLMETLEGDTDLLEARGRKRTLATLDIQNSFFQSLISWSFSLGLPFALGIWGAFRLYKRNRKRGLKEA